MLEAHDLLDASEVHAEFLGQAADLAQVVDVALAVQARLAAGAAGTDQALAFVQPQRLGVHIHQFCGHGNHVHRAMFGVRGHNLT